MKYLIALYLVICPIFMIPGMELRSAQELCFHIASVALIASGFFFNNKPVKQNKLNLWIGITTLWFLFVFVQHQRGWTIALNVVLGVLTYFTVIRTMKREDIPFILKTLLGMTLFTLLYLGLQYLGFDLRGVVERGNGGVPDCSFLGIKAAYGMYMALMTPLTMGLSSICAIFFVPTVLSYSTGAVAACTFSVMFFLWFRRRLLFWIAIIPLLAGSVLFVIKMDNPMGMQTSRLPMWKLVIQDCFRKPLGYGLDSFRNPPYGHWLYFKNSWDNVSYRAIKNNDGTISVDASHITPEFLERIKKNPNIADHWDHPHNEPLKLNYEAGFPATFSIFMIMFYAWKRFWCSRKDDYTVAFMAALISFVIFSMTQFPLHLSRIGHILPIISGLFFICTEEDGTYKI